MLTRFCLYGFLKNQRYFEPFLWLAFLDKGLSFFEIGVLVAVQGMTMVVLEIPSGAIADLFGRRRSMVLSFAAYLSCFLVLGLAESYWAICGAMVLYGIGESFRTGTHKSLIFAWLKLEGRAEEKTRVYGVTRSWSKFGSAVCAPIAAGLVYMTGGYTALFFASMVPCVLSIVNLLGYPDAIDPPRERRATVGEVSRHLSASARDILTIAPLRRLVGESMVFHGLFRASKDYLQPALAAAAVVWFGAATAALDLDPRDLDPRDLALLVGTVYFLLSVAEGIASRNAHRVAKRVGGDAQAVRWSWGCLLLLFGVLAAGSATNLSVVVITAFVALIVLQNIWRPIMTSQIYEAIDDQKGTTVLSIESQGQRLTMTVLAPLFGFLADWADESFWPIATVAAAIALVFFARGAASKG